MVKKPIELIENTIDLAESQAIQKSLTIDWGNSPLGASCPKITPGMFTPGNPIVCPFKPGWRRPWDDIDMSALYEMNYHITINPDPMNQLSKDVYDKKVMFTIFRQFLEECKKNKYYKNIICVYEYGAKGKRYGKLHFHCLFKTHCCNKIKEIACKYFGSSKKNRHITTVVVKRITIDKVSGDIRSDQEKVDNYKEQVDYIMHKYMKKETQNKVKCLYSNMIKKI